ncbi:MAG TPA: right-handed parallel beta-helix repeat-containing protein [Gammaproteobacteria bacterium]|nr:right-handed parallel beta-helix repeat-containing protein [Gammaproteobacteria bacterium]
MVALASILVEYSRTRFVNSTITGNSGSEKRINTVLGRFGGGVYVSFQAGVLILNSTISGNSADFDGGLYISDEYSGATVTHFTVTGNTATSQGGGVFAGYNLELNRTILSGNSAPAAREVYVSDRVDLKVGNFNIFGFNGSSGVEGFSPGITDIVPSQALSEILDTGLASNDGPSRTQALVGGSPAIDIIANGTCPSPAKDQRGVSRSQDGNWDGGRPVRLARLSGPSLYDDPERDVCQGSAGTDSGIACEQKIYAVAALRRAIRRG